MEKKYYYLMKGKKILISKELHKEFKKLTNKEGYQTRQHYKHTISLEDLPKTIHTGEDIEETVLTNIETEILYKSLSMLKQEELLLLDALFFANISERALAKKMGVSHKAINKRKHRILRQLKKILTNLSF